MPVDYVRLSKTITHALRHAPEQYGLELDSEGWVAVDELLAALRQRCPSWRTLTIDDVVTMMAQSAKQRYGLYEGRIRARYGLSLARAIDRMPSEPPDLLYHGTAPHALARIRAEGLRSMRRKVVHLRRTKRQRMMSAAAMPRSRSSLRSERARLMMAVCGFSMARRTCGSVRRSRPCLSNSLDLDRLIEYS